MKIISKQDDVVERLPAGSKITVDNVTLEIISYIKSGPICHCSGCGQVTPALRDFKDYTKEFYEKWLTSHNGMFKTLHEENLRKYKADSK